MAKNIIEIIIKAVDEASKEIQGISANLEKNRNAIMKVGAVSGAAFAALTFGVKDAAQESMELNNALIGLSSIAAGVGVDVNQATDAAKSLADDGLMTVAEAATSLKNLLSRGFSLPEAVEMMNRFKDSAAFGRQASLSFGQAITGATEGLKNENSVLVDNAGVTKNVSVMWEDYAEAHGKSVKDLTDAEKRQAEYNGIMEETRFQVGDAAKLTQTFSGELSAFTAETKMAKAAVGDALEPTLAKLTGTARDVVSTFREWAEDNPKTVAGLVTFGAAASGGLMTLSAIGLMLPSIIKGFQLVTSNVKLAAAAQWLWNAALNANPIGIVIGLVTALAGTLVYLYKTNDTARYQMLQAWGSIKVGVMTAIDAILRKLQELTSFVPGLNEKIQQYRDSLSQMIDDEKAVQSMRKAEKAMSDYADARQREIERNNEAATSYKNVTDKIEENTAALGGVGDKGGGNTKAVRDNTEAMSYAEQQLIKFRAAYIAASGASSNLTAEHKYFNDSLYVVQQRINSLREQIQLKSAEENVDAEVIKALLEEYDNWISKEKDLQDQLKKTNEQLKKQIDQKITLADLGGGKSKKEVAELASVIYLQNQMEKKGTITSEDLNKLPKFHSGKAAGSTSKEIPAIIHDNEWVIPDEDVKRVPTAGMGGINFVLQFNQPVYGLSDLERQIRNILERMDVASILHRQLARAGVRV